MGGGPGISTNIGDVETPLRRRNSSIGSAVLVDTPSTVASEKSPVPDRNHGQHGEGAASSSAGRSAPQAQPLLRKNRKLKRTGKQGKGGVEKRGEEEGKEGKGASAAKRARRVERGELNKRSRRTVGALLVEEEAELDGSDSGDELCDSDGMRASQDSFLNDASQDSRASTQGEYVQPLTTSSHTQPCRHTANHTHTQTHQSRQPVDHAQPYTPSPP